MVNEGPSALEQQFMNFDAFIREQRKELPLKLSQLSSENEKQQLLDQFFDKVDLEKRKVMQNIAYSNLAAKKSPGKKSRKSPTKSPNKKPRKENDENASPEKELSIDYTSPTAKKAPVSNESPNKEDGDLS